MLAGLSSLAGQAASKVSASKVLCRRTLLAAAALTLAGCASSNVGVDIPGVPGATRAGADRYATTQSMRDSKGVLPPYMQGRKVVRAAVILPFSHQNAQVREDSDALLKGAELALFEQAGEGFMLLPKDSGSTADSAKDAAKLALKDGADIILGPLFGATVPEAAEAARAKNVPLISFTNDRAAAKSGAYMLSFTPDQEISRIVSYAAKRGYTRFAILAPDSELGTRAQAAFQAAVTAAGGVVTVSQRYPRDPSQLQTPIASAAAAIRAAGGKQAILIPERGVLLRAIAPLLIVNKVDMTRTKLIGTSAWGEEDVTKEPALKGGWYAAPDPAAHAAFETRFEKAYGKKPTKLASLAYDAAALAASLGANGPEGVTRNRLENADGFMGADGLFRFLPDGTAERGLAIIEVQQGATKVADPSPRRFPAPGA